MDVKITLPLLPLRDIVVFPNMVIPLFVGRDKSISALNEVMKKDKKIILVTQKNSEIDDPKKTDIFTYGCEGNILQLLKLPDGTVKVLVEGQERVKITKIHHETGKYLNCNVELAKDLNITKDLETYSQNLLKKFEKLMFLNKKDVNENLTNLKSSKDVVQIANNICSNLNIQIFEKSENLNSNIYC